ncbi:hypothetical protein BALCAV_0208975 [Alkalihalobacillus alcalophilus ATCC 27647 = CGMCC 1.3604]|uniref:Uncharacterized protein n=1 Tax=Alkalihalobacillus alcalophilus ATCC 27647 = CGMCC 1.3604 TaxID=1218173 RepID=A0A094YVW0_ALKAL|nr:hypothetical protein BALCAV_0208975 [Alkalihalobacillus alcalophilus ATCC 27647 = CGMCC 1.3604]
MFFYSMRKPNLDSIPLSSGQTDTETPAGINRLMRPRKRAEEAHEVPAGRGVSVWERPPKHIVHCIFFLNAQFIRLV